MPITVKYMHGDYAAQARGVHANATHTTQGPNRNTSRKRTRSVFSHELRKNCPLMHRWNWSREVSQQNIKSLVNC